MNQNELHSSLEKMHSELNKVSTLDAESKTILLQISNDINNLLAGAANEDETVIEEKDNLINSLKDSAAAFDSEYPELAESIHIVIHTLSNMGI